MSRMEGDFWRERLDTVLPQTIPSQHERLARTRHPRIARRCRSRRRRCASRATRQRLHHPDVLGFRRRQVDRGGELCARRTGATPTIEAKIDAIVDDLDKAQAPDGYLNCWYIGRETDKRWTNLRDNHELYCAGHMLEGAIAYFQATGRRQLLDIMLRYVDHIATVFGPGAGPEARLLRPPGDRAGADQALPGHRRPEAPRPRGLLHQRARAAAAALLRHRGARRAATTRRTTGAEDLRVQPVAQAGARAGQGGRPRRAGDVHVHRHGRPRRRARRR